MGTDSIQQDEAQGTEARQYRLESRSAIMAMFKVSKETVAKWRKAGAPITKVGRKCQADYYTLWNWLAQSSRKK